MIQNPNQATFVMIFLSYMITFGNTLDESRVS